MYTKIFITLLTEILQSLRKPKNNLKYTDDTQSANGKKLSLVILQKADQLN